MAAGFDTPFTRLVGCPILVQLAVMGGGVGTPELAAAVCEAGGLGMLSSTFPLPVGEQLDQLQARTNRPVGVGFFAFLVPAMTAEVELAASRAQVVDIFWGDPEAAVVNRIHAGGALAFWQVGSPTRRWVRSTQDAMPSSPKGSRREAMSEARPRCSGCSTRSSRRSVSPSLPPVASQAAQHWLPS